MKKLTIITLATLLILSILSLVGCAGANETQNKETAQSYDNVPGTNVPMYPNAQQVYSSEYNIIYATTDSGKVVNNFYKRHPDLKKGKGSGSFKKGYYYYETPLSDLVRAFLRDKRQKKIDEINAYIDEFGGLQVVGIYDANMDVQFRKLMLGPFFSEIPLDKTLILFAISEGM